MQNAEGRLKTFTKGHPFKARSTTLPPARLLARHGFSWTGQGTTTLCHACGSRIDWADGLAGLGGARRDGAISQQVARRHLDVGPDCPLAHLLLLVPPGGAEEGQPEAGRNAARERLEEEVRWKERTFHLGVGPLPAAAGGPRGRRTRSTSASSASAERPALLTWPHEQSGPAICARAMAAAGFLYTPTPESRDLATCLDCGVELDGWEAEDDPLTEHRKRTGKRCRFLLALERMESPALEKQAPPSPAPVHLDVPLGHTVRAYLKEQLQHSLAGARAEMEGMLAEFLAAVPEHAAPTPSLARAS